MLLPLEGNGSASESKKPRDAIDDDVLSLAVVIDNNIEPE
jgi:hypothetical protein